MRILEFDIEKQRLKKNKDCDFSNIVAGSFGYLKTKFNFSQEEWSGCKKAVSFWKGDEEFAVLLDENDMCSVPAEVLNEEKFSITVTGVRPYYRITTTKVSIKQEIK